LDRLVEGNGRIFVGKSLLLDRNFTPGFFKLVCHSGNFGSELHLGSFGKGALGCLVAASPIWNDQ